MVDLQSPVLNGTFVLISLPNYKTSSTGRTYSGRGIKA